MKIKMNLKRYFTIITLLIGLSLVSIAAELPSLGVRNAAQQGLEIFIKSGRLPTAQLNQMGITPEQVNTVMLSEGFKVYKTDETRLLYSAESFDRLSEATEMWRFLVVSGDKAVSLVTVELTDGKWKPVSVGASEIAERFQQILNTWSVQDGYDHRFIRTYNATFDLVEISRAGDIIGYIPMSTAPGLEGSNRTGFNPAFIMMESDFRSSLGDKVERARLAAENMAEFSNEDNRQGQTGSPSFNASQELDTAASTETNILDFPEVIQKHNQWCWAACSKSILDYYGITVEVDLPLIGIVNLPESQCSIANWAWSNDGYNYGNSCGNETFNANESWNSPNSMYTNDNRSIRAILEHRGVSASGSSSDLSFSQTQTEIDDNDPFVIRWGWSGGGGHFIVGYGYHKVTIIVTVKITYYMDPWPGEGLLSASHSWVQSGGNHTWTHTLKTSY